MSGGTFIILSKMEPKNIRLFQGGCGGSLLGTGACNSTLNTKKRDRGEQSPCITDESRMIEPIYDDAHCI